MPKILAFSSSLVTFKFSVRNIFETRLLLKIFDADLPYKLSYFEPLCLPAKRAAETVIRSIKHVCASGWFVLPVGLCEWKIIAAHSILTITFRTF